MYRDLQLRKIQLSTSFQKHTYICRYHCNVCHSRLRQVHELVAANNSADNSAPTPAFTASDPTPSQGSPHTWNSAAHAAAVTCLAWNERETTLTSGDASGLVIVWTAHARGWKKAMANQRRAGPREP